MTSVSSVGAGTRYSSSVRPPGPEAAGAVGPDQWAGRPRRVRPAPGARSSGLDGGETHDEAAVQARGLAGGGAGARGGAGAEERGRPGTRLDSLSRSAADH